ncbi:hypothetical protein [Streptomyces sp. NPDC088350]|uniref:hypothetical protein n=1 Tax=Streptomyces sp. NPDC088350 TaxID=3365854 RepID=UPI0038121843
MCRRRCDRHKQCGSLVLHQEMQQCYRTDSDQESGAERWVLKGRIDRAATDEHKQYRSLICLTVHW